MFQRIRSLSVAILGAFALWACASAPVPAGAAPVVATPTAVNLPGFEYKLGSGDKVRIIVFGQTDLSGEFSLDGSGAISIPLIGKIDALNLTTVQLEQAIANRLKDGYLNDPRVSAQVLNFRPFFILGEVNKPGEYPYADGMTILKAVATAGGHTYRADQRRVFIKRAESGKEEAVAVTSNTAVHPGDTIRIPERFF
ncbi:MAG: polysaccharide biosynthesis/export family protein [Caulobacterales bacterium]|jgi:polysaccharide export outer membrane protein